VKLPDDEREHVGDELKATLHGGFASEEVEQAWATEIEGRAAEIDSGKAVLRHWE
jgi:hypothetical protein